MLATVSIAAEDQAKSTPTVDEIAKILDLRTLPLPQGATTNAQRQLGALNYQVNGDVKSAFTYQQQQLTKAGWKELPGSQIDAAYCSGMFSKSGFTVSVSSFDAGGMSQVSLINFGNLQLAKLPVVKGAKAVFANEASANFSVAMRPVDAAATTRKLLTDAGWEPFGSISNPPDMESLTFKRNAVQLSVFIPASPVEKGSSGVMYSAMVLSADIPAPLNAEKLEYVDSFKRLQFETVDDFNAVAKFYQQRLAKQHWKPTTELLSQEDSFHRHIATQVFRNHAQDILTLDLQTSDGRSRAQLTHLTAAESAAIEKRQKEAALKLVAENKANEAAQKEIPKPAVQFPAGLDGVDVEKTAQDAITEALKGITAAPEKGTTAKSVTPGNDKDVVSVPIPDNAKTVTQTSGNVLQIKFPAKAGEAAATIIRDQLRAADWEAGKNDKLGKTSGNLTLTRGGKTLTLSYVDTGFTDVNLMLIGIGVKLESGKVDPNAKPSDKPQPASEPDPARPKSRNTKPKSEDNKPTFTLPDRVEKPKREIEKLPKLPNAAKLTADDEPVTLTNVVAFEAVDGDRWVTRVIATANPIKQAAIIEQLRKTGDYDTSGLGTPYARLELNDQDSPNSMSLAANQSLGSTGSSGLKGEAIVEGGRARGSIAMTEPKSFFDHTIIGEISFDVPLLTRDSVPAKRLTDAKKLENSGKLLIDDKPVILASVVAYEVKVSDGKQTAILFTEKPINLSKLKESLAKDGSDSGLFEFQSQVKVSIDKEDRPVMMNLYSDGASLSSNSSMVGDVVIEDGRARGTVKLGKPSEFFGKTFSFEITFDVDVMLLPAATSE